MHFSNSSQRHELQPLADIIEIENGIAILVDIPGVSEENIFLEIENNNLLLRAIMDNHFSDLFSPLTDKYADNSEKEIQLMEWVENDYFLRIFLAEGLDKENILVYLKNGVLVINIEYTANYSKKTKPPFSSKFLF